MPRPQPDPARADLTRRDISPLDAPGAAWGFRRDAFTLFILLRDSLLAFPKQPTVAHLSSLIAAIEVTPCIMHIGLTRRDGEERGIESEKQSEKERESEKRLVYKGAPRYTRAQFKFSDRLTATGTFSMYIYTFKSTLGPVVSPA